MLTGHELGMYLRRAYLSMHRRSDGKFVRYGVTADQFILLTALVRGGGAAKQKDIVERICSDPNTVAKMLAGLERKGLIARRPHPTDRRAQSITLTPRGKRLQKKLLDFDESFQAVLLSLFRKGELATLVECLDRIAGLMLSANRAGPGTD